MASTPRVSRSIRQWSSVWALPFVAALALAACGGKVVVDSGTTSGDGGAGGTTVSSATTMPSTGAVGPLTCNAALAHLEECIPGSTTMIPPLPACEGQILCQFSCILNVSCGGLTGTDQASSEQFATCISACG